MCGEKSPEDRCGRERAGSRQGAGRSGQGAAGQQEAVRDSAWAPGTLPPSGTRIQGRCGRSERDGPGGAAGPPGQTEK